MMKDFRTIAGIVLAAALTYVFVRFVWKRKATAANLPNQLFADILPLLENSELQAGEAIGTWQLVGAYRGRTFQLKAITDTLAVRKLPSLWLMVTLPEPQSSEATIDVMMRPQGPTTFSNFDFLPRTLPTPDGFPEDAVIRADGNQSTFPEDAMHPPLQLLQSSRGKELLISPKGLRLVFQAAEADRARYGVYREANFSNTIISAATAQKAMDSLITLSDNLRSP